VKVISKLPTDPNEIRDPQPDEVPTGPPVVQHHGVDIRSTAAAWVTPLIARLSRGRDEPASVGRVRPPGRPGNLVRIRPPKVGRLDFGTQNSLASVDV
jgi:hypothetical protein